MTPTIKVKSCTGATMHMIRDTHFPLHFSLSLSLAQLKLSHVEVYATRTHTPLTSNKIRQPLI